MREGGREGQKRRGEKSHRGKVRNRASDLEQPVSEGTEASA
jgi:hypothetical protein